METMKRTVTCGALRASDAGTRIVLNGWVHRHRDHGGILFFDIRDRYGITQVVVDADAPADLRSVCAELRFEYCVAVEGTVRARPGSMANPNMPTGAIEVQASRMVILSRCEVLPFMVDERAEAKDDTRLTYRYLDLRTGAMQRNIALRHRAAFATREYLAGKGFYEIETPTFIKSTPEGARDYLVPSRLNPGCFYALPQSPQLYKQLLMVSGFDRYFQIARCYRDEDARGDRQPEFTQIDIEMSFVSREDVFTLVEGLMAHVFKESIGATLEVPFARLPYDDAMNLYGSDKPDLRFDLAMKDFGPFAKQGGFEVFRKVVEDGGVVKSLVAPGCGEYSRKQITELESVAKVYGAAGLAWMKVTEAGLDGGISKFYAEQAAGIKAALGAKAGDLILLVGAEFRTACLSLGAVRSQLGKQLNLADPKQFRFCWIVDFPLFEWNAEEKKWDPAHHMFTMPQERFVADFEKRPGEVKGDLYDLVCNGVELASGSIRIHDPQLQKRIFSFLGFSEELAQKRFGFLLEAFRYGPPPHGGIAPGFDRLVAMMAGEPTIRDVIAFPKNTLGQCPMDGSPSEVDAAQLRDLHIRVEEKKS
ncbi:MAG TPA: aspartate--tRNA ligase [Spirochaetia bacterium]|nr:aspartate--tRNA ligase [Spirochaetia bacterium]